MQFPYAFGKKPYPFYRYFGVFLHEKRGYPTPGKTILHPILHPKMPANTGCLGYGCRKCRFLFKNFFCGERKREGTHRPGSYKTSDFFGQKYGCFASKVRMFASKKSDVFVFRKGSGQRVPILEEENTPSMEGVEYGKTGTGNVAPDRYPLCPGCSTQGIGLDAGEATLSEGTDVNPLVGSGEKHGLAGLQRGGVSF